MTTSAGSWFRWSGRVGGWVLAVVFLGNLHAAEIAIIPEPLLVQPGEGAFTITRDMRILAEAGKTEAAAVGEQLCGALNRSTGFGLKVEPAPGPSPRSVWLTTQNANPALGPEGYTLTADKDGVTIAASAGAGLFYGTVTLLQLLPPQVFSRDVVNPPVAWDVPAVRIEDRPRFGWRGLMLDVSRHFFSKEEVRNYLDLMALHKLNTFHWHLVDDNGWRVEIKAYPKLTSVGAWRDGIGFGLDPKAGTAYGPDGRYGGFYTQDDIRELVAYAAARYITVVPEIEMPGHSGAALGAYPELTCSGKSGNVYCAGNDASFTFLRDVLTEVMALFPSKYIHVGGDEVSKDAWKACPKCLQRRQQEGLKDENELQSYFIRRMEQSINANGRTLIGWDEILEGGLAPNATVMSWRGIKGGIAAANAGHDVVMTPTSHCYFDYYQGEGGEPKAIGGFLPLENVYAFEPVPAELPADKARHVLGAGGNLWSEFFPNYAHVQYMTYPRACAMAELCWTDKERRNRDAFLQRLRLHEKRLDALQVSYRVPPPAGLDQAIVLRPDGMIELKPLIPGGEIRYTVNGDLPSSASTSYTAPFKPEQTGLVKVAYSNPDPPRWYRAEAFILARPLAFVTTSMSPYADNTLDRAFDGKDDTVFYHSRAMVKDDHLTIRLAAPQVLHSIKVLTGRPDRPKDTMYDGDVVEVSTDGKAFRKVLEFKDGVVGGPLPAEPITALRIRVTQEHGKYWLVLREFALE